MTNNTELQTTISYDSQQLGQLGWSDYFDVQLADMTATGRIARVISVQRNLFLVADGQDEWLCSPAGRLLHEDRRSHIATGDWVVVNDTLITGVLPRRNLLSRGEAGSRGNQTQTPHREQAIAANLDTVFIVCGLDRDFNLRRLERYMTLVHNCGITPVVVLTKADLHEDTEPFLTETESIAFGVPVVLASKQDGRGRVELEGYLRPGQTVAMVGSSGAGKSTLANMLHGSDLQATSAVSASDGKGRHTTTVRELIPMPQGGMLMDNPGIREIAFHGDGHGLDAAFGDIRDLADMCRFANCSHHHEPGCAVLNAVQTGELPQARLESYRKMKSEMEYLSERHTKSADRLEKERWQGISKRIKSMKRMKGR